MTAVSFFCENKLIRFTILFYIIGIIGLSVHQTQRLFIWLIPWSLLLYCVIIGMHDHELTHKESLWRYALIALLGFLVEVLGIRSSFPFGAYSYQETLGIKLFQVPLIIGLNWALITYLSANLALLWSQNIWIKSLAGALFMLLYDIILEQVAPKLSMWSFDGFVPLTNYIAWFILGFIFNFLLHTNPRSHFQPLGVVIYVCQIIFFIILILLLP